MIYYFRKDDEWCYPLKVQKDFMKKNGLNEMEVYKAVRDVGEGFFTCIEYVEIGESSDSCGKQCDKYNPRNGKNGICKHHRNTYSHGEKIILRNKDKD